MKTTRPTKELPVLLHKNEDSDGEPVEEEEKPEEDLEEDPEEDPVEDPEEDPEEEYEEYIEEISEEELESDPEEESNAEPNKETGGTGEDAVSEALDVEIAPKQRRRKTRWDLQPEQDEEMGEGGDGVKVKKTRWGSGVSQSNSDGSFMLPESLSDFIDSETDARVRWLKQKLVALNEEILKLETGENNLKEEEARRTHIEYLVGKRQKLLVEVFLKDSKSRFTVGCGGRKSKFSKKVYIPMKEYPSYNFVGLILGPRGNTQKKMEVESGASIKLRGKGSYLGKEVKFEDDDEDLHVFIEAHTEKSLEAAVAMVEKLLVPLDDKDNKFKLAQMEELANIRGTNFNACQLCHDPSHKTYACPNRKSTFEEVTSCTKCGSFSHLIASCPLNAKPNPPIKVINEANLYVGYIPQTADENWLKERFCPFGKISSVKIIVDHTTALCKGYGFVNFENPTDAAMAVKHMNGNQVEGKILVVRVAGLRPQPQAVFSPISPYPTTLAISPNISGFAGPWVGPPGLFLHPQFPQQPGLPAVYPFLGLGPPGLFVHPHFSQQPGLPALDPFPAISPDISSQMGPWSAPPGLSQITMDLSGQYYATPSLSKAMDIPSQVHPFPAISPDISSQLGPWSGPPGPSQITMDPSGQYYSTPSLSKAMEIPSQIDPSSVYAKQAPGLSSGSSQFPGDPGYRSSSSLFPGDPDYRGSSSLFTDQ